MLQRARELSLTVGDAELEARIGEIKKDYSNDGFDALFGNGGISLYRLERGAAKADASREGHCPGCECKNPGDGRGGGTLLQSQSQGLRHRRGESAPHRSSSATGTVAEEILKRLKAGEDFGKVAREVSIGPEAARGGDLGFFERGMMPEAIDRMVFSLPVGKMSGVVQSPYGFHIFKVLGQARRAAAEVCGGEGRR